MQLPVQLRPMMRVLSDEGVRSIHKATPDILEETGVEMRDPQARDLLLEDDARESNGRIKILEKLVDKHLGNSRSGHQFFIRVRLKNAIERDHPGY